MAHQLADETLATIFFDHFDVSDDDFACITSRQSPFALRPLGSSSNVLLVCKRWMRVATPLLYETVILRSQAQANALAFALKSTPSLGPYIRKLRVEGGFGSAGARIMEASANITDLWLTLDLYAQDKAVPMYTTMANRINPRRVLVYGQSLPKNANSNKAVEMLGEYIPSWSNLRDVYVSTVVVYETPIGRALIAVPQLDVLRLANFHIPFPGDPTSAFLRDCTARRIELCFARDDLIESIMGRLEGLSARKRNSLVIMRQVPRESLTQTAPAAPFEAMPLNPSFVPLHDVPEAIKYRIWSRVLRFLAEGHDEIARTTKYNCLLTCKLFRSLAVPIFCRDVNLKSDRAIISFARLLRDRPELASRVRTLTISERPSRDPPHEWAGPIAGSEACSALVAAIPQLNHLVHADLVRIALPRLGVLHTERLKSARMLIRAPDEEPHVLGRFARLTALTLKTSAYPCKDMQFVLSGGETLAQLDTLTLAGCGFDGPGLAGTLAALPLPRLRVLDVRELCAAEHAPGVHWAPFARAHGAKLLALLVPPWLLADALPHCPKLVELRVLGTDPAGDTIAIPTDGFAAPLVALETLVCPGFGLDMWPLIRPRSKIMKPFNAWFEFLASAEARRLFPALRAVRVDEAELWPTSEREIAKSTIARCAEALLECGIAMYDRDGRSWKPRLKTSRRK